MKCLSEPFTIGQLWVERNIINDEPDYQRESGLWSAEKQQLFIDSLFNGFDVPKLYFHDLRGTDPKFHYAVVDGKQRLHTIWNYVKGSLATAPDFRLSDDLGKASPPQGSCRFADLTEEWQEAFKAKTLTVVLIQNADDEDIEELFFRLNNGEPLNAAEKRNAIGGKITELIRTVSADPFFKKHLTVPNKRYQHYEISAKLLLIEKTESDTGVAIPDLKKRFVDKMVEENKEYPQGSAKGLTKRVTDNLHLLMRVFNEKDRLLAKQAYPPLYYIWVKQMSKEYAHKQMYSRMHAFLEGFAALRTKNLQLPEDQIDPVLVEFGRLMQQGTNDKGSLERRSGILTRYFLQQHPEVTVRDKFRSFTDDERYAIWILGGKKCAECGRTLSDVSEMEADHKIQWAHGGETTLENGRSLCEGCNASLAQKVA